MEDQNVKSNMEHMETQSKYLLQFHCDTIFLFIPCIYYNTYLYF